MLYLFLRKGKTQTWYMISDLKSMRSLSNLSGIWSPRSIFIICKFYASLLVLITNTFQFWTFLSGVSFTLSLLPFVCLHWNLKWALLRLLRISNTENLLEFWVNHLNNHKVWKSIKKDNKQDKMIKNSWCGVGATKSIKNNQDQNFAKAD